MTSVYIDLDFYWASVGIICISLAGFWGFKRLKSLITGR